uniref:Uncharacterized protein n=1 Tax=Bionectria ochroleuca TaxID=29856 RepID=A0A8H7TSH2_BIOOC
MYCRVLRQSSSSPSGSARLCINLIDHGPWGLGLGPPGPTSYRWASASPEPPLLPACMTPLPRRQQATRLGFSQQSTQPWAPVKSWASLTERIQHCSNKRKQFMRN